MQARFNSFVIAQINSAVYLWNTGNYSTKLLLSLHVSVDVSMV